MCGSPPVRLSTSVAVRGSLTWDHESRTDSLTIGTTPESILAMVNSEKLSQMFVWAKLKQLLCFYTFSQTLFWPCLTWGLLAGIKVLSIWVKTFNNELRVLRSELSEENINPWLTPGSVIHSLFWNLDLLQETGNNVCLSENTSSFVSCGTSIRDMRNIFVF